MKFEVVVTVWKDGLFKSRDRIESDDITLLNSQVEYVIEGIKNKLEAEEKNKPIIDDDIPF